MIFEGSRLEARGYRQRITSANGQCWVLIVIQERDRREGESGIVMVRNSSMR